MRRWMLVATTAGLLSACGQAEPTAPAPTEPTPAATEAAEPEAISSPADLEGFTHAAGEDLFGYYFPTQPVQIGDWRLDHIHMGGAMEFAAWEGGERTETYAPVMLEFSDVTSPISTNELGQEFHERSIRVLPTAYRVGEGDFRFVGRHPQIGDVRIDGMIDLAQLKAERDRGGLSQAEAAPLLKTSAQIGPEAFRNLSFVWFGGD
ncbi:MAG: hypothetical protein KKA45_03520 [Alphaproteobacteria bacterium]|nr:hypothetical protein [Alphaproteobacteria bacterium]